MPAIDLFQAFEDFNIRLNTLLFKKFDQYRFDFRSISKRYFDLLCGRYLPFLTDRVKLLYLSNNDETCDEINYFLSHNLTFCQFANLQSLSISDLRSENVMCQLLDECQHFQNLIHLKFKECEFQHENMAIGQRLNNIWQLPKLTQCYLDIDLQEWRLKDKQLLCLPTISTPIQSLTIKVFNYKLNELVCIIAHAPYLRYLDVCAMDGIDKTPLNFPISSLTRLKITVHESPFALGELLQNMPNLYHLTADVSCIDLDGYQWKRIIVNHLSKLKIFELRMELSPIERQHLNQMQASFRTHMKTQLSQKAQN